MLRRREVVDLALWSSFASHAAMVDICSEKASEVDRRRPKNEHSIADRYFWSDWGPASHVGRTPQVVRKWSNFAGKRLRASRERRKGPRFAPRGRRWGENWRDLLREGAGRARFGAGGGESSTGVRPARLLQGAPERCREAPGGGNGQILVGFLRFLRRREGWMCENHEQSTVWGPGRGRVHGKGTRVATRQNAHFGPNCQKAHWFFDF